MEWLFDARDARAAREARTEFGRHVNHYFGSEVDVMSAELILGELIGNVLRHAPGKTVVKANFDERGVTIAVKDSGNGFSQPLVNRETSILSESGRGLAIVLRLADSVEIDCPSDDGCCVRARLEVVRPSAN